MQNIRLETVKNTEQVHLVGVTIWREMEDEKLNRVVLQDTTGTILVISREPYGAMSILRPAAPRKEKRYRLAGSIGEFLLVPRDFEDRFEAEQAKAASLHPEYLGITEIEIEVKE